MANVYGRSKQEIKANAIAKRLAAALTEIESGYDDPTSIFEGAAIHLRSAPQGARDALKALREYYRA